MGVNSACRNLPIFIKAIATLLKDLLLCFQMYEHFIFCEDAPIEVKSMVALDDH